MLDKFENIEKYTRAINTLNDLASRNSLAVTYAVYIELGEMIFSARFIDCIGDVFSIELPISNLFQSKFPEVLIRANFSISHNLYMDKKEQENES